VGRQLGEAVSVGRNDVDSKKDGEAVGPFVGTLRDLTVGDRVGMRGKNGMKVGLVVGGHEGKTVGELEGRDDGTCDGAAVGSEVGETLGSVVGTRDGSDVGTGFSGRERWLSGRRGSRIQRCLCYVMQASPTLYTFLTG
jgi:hypothetical protein